MADIVINHRVGTTQGHGGMYNRYDGIPLSWDERAVTSCTGGLVTTLNSFWSVSDCMYGKLINLPSFYLYLLMFQLFVSFFPPHCCYIIKAQTWEEKERGDGCYKYGALCASTSGYFLLSRMWMGYACADLSKLTNKTAVLPVNMAWLLIFIVPWNEGWKSNIRVLDLLIPYSRVTAALGITSMGFQTLIIASILFEKILQHGCSGSEITLAFKISVLTLQGGKYYSVSATVLYLISLVFYIYIYISKMLLF